MSISANSSFEFKLPQNLRVGVSELLETFTFSYLGADAIRSQPGRRFHGETPVSTIQKSILAMLNFILSAVKLKPFLLAV